MSRTIQVLPDPQAVATAAADVIVEAARSAIEREGSFSIALSGGNTPRPLYQLLATERYRSQIHWPAVQAYFSDERCVPPDHADSNFRMACELLLDAVPIAYENIHRMRGEIEPEAAATEYGQLLKERFGDGGLDLVLLGMGQDGHTASLFPHTAALLETHHRCVANHVPQRNFWRITLTAPFINRAANVLLLATGAEKAARVAEALEGPEDPQRLPVQLIAPSPGRLLWLLDAAAAGMG